MPFFSPDAELLSYAAFLRWLSLRRRLAFLPDAAARHVTLMLITLSLRFRHYVVVSLRH